VPIRGYHHKPPYFTLAFLRTFFYPSCRFPLPRFLPPLPFALTFHPSFLTLTFLPRLSVSLLYVVALCVKMRYVILCIKRLLIFSFLEDVDDDAFLDCLHEHHGLQSDLAYTLSGIFCDELLPPHGGVNWS